MSQFATRDTQAPRLLWHPLVHKYGYGEELQYFLLRLESDASSVAERLDDLLRSIELTSYCAYTVFGYYDALVRVWLTESKKRRVLLAFQNKDEILAVSRFTATGIRYLWAQDVGDLLQDSDAVERSVARERSHIRELSAQGAQISAESLPGPSVGTLDAELLEQLREASLLFDLASETDPGTPSGTRAAPIKFYIALQPSAPPPLDTEDEMGSLATELRESSVPQLKACSLYAGYGFATYMIRARAAAYSDVLATTAAVDRLLAKFPHLRAMTLLIANQDAFECDNMNSVTVTSNGDDFLMVLLSPDSKTTFEALPEQQRQALRDIVTAENADWLKSADLEKQAGKILDAFLSNDLTAVAQALFYVPLVEAYFAIYLRTIWAECLTDGNRQWPSKLGEIAKEAGLANHLDVDEPKTWTFRNHYDLARASAGRLAEIGTRMAQDLGADWKVSVANAVFLRNLVAHGRLATLTRFDDFQNESGRVLSGALQTRSLFEQLGKLTKKPDT